MMLGRFVFGLGGESLLVAQWAFVARWFRGVRGLSLAFSITVGCSGIGSSINFIVSPEIAARHGVQAAVLVGVFVCVGSFVCCIGMLALDVHGERIGLVPIEVINNGEGDKDAKGGAAAGAAPVVSVATIRNLGARFWLLAVICFAAFGCLFPFIGIALNFFVRKYAVASDTASTWCSVFQFASAASSFVLGVLVDKTGRLCQWIIVAMALIVAAHGAIFWLARPNAVAVVSVLGAAYSLLASSLWPAVPYVVPAASVGVAFGFLTSLQNGALALYPLLTGAILDAYTGAKKTLTGACLAYSRSGFTNTSGFAPGSLSNCSNNTDAPLPDLKGFECAEILFMCTALVGVLLGVLLLVLDRRSEFPALSCAAEDRPPSPADDLAASDCKPTAPLIVGAVPDDAKPSQIYGATNDLQ